MILVFFNLETSATLNIQVNKYIIISFVYVNVHIKCIDSALRERRQEQRAAQGVPIPGARAAGPEEGRGGFEGGARHRQHGPEGGAHQVRTIMMLFMM